MIVSSAFRTIAVMVAVSMAAIAQTPGQLEPKLPTKADAQQSYALYLPTAYSTAKHWPVLYILDPGARGAFAAERFRAAAEQHGYIVAASNVSRNGPAEPSLKALQSMSVDVESRFAVDPERRYVAGFSGGARMAFLAASVCPKCFAGVLAAGAGLPNGVKLDSAPEFAYYAMVGRGDFNYAEVTALAPTLERVHASYRIATFDGTHEWPTADALAQALTWMNFVAERSEQQKKAPAEFAAWAEKEFAARVSAVQTIAAGDPVQAAREYDSIVRDFRGLHDTAAVEKERQRLRGSQEYKRALKDDQKIAARTEELSIRFDGTVQALLAANGTLERQAPRAYAVQQINQFRADSASKDKFTALVAQRVISSSTVTLLQLGDQQKSSDNAVDLADLYTLLAPDSPGSWYWLALAHTSAGHKRNAIAALKRSVELGTPKTRVAEDERLKPLASEGDFKTLLK
jgi:poly(3-hydroxybutyrate) depolymerase